MLSFSSLRYAREHDPLTECYPVLLRGFSMLLIYNSFVLLEVLQHNEAITSSPLLDHPPPQPGLLR